MLPEFLAWNSLPFDFSRIILPVILVKITIVVIIIIIIKIIITITMIVKQ